MKTHKITEVKPTSLQENSHTGIAADVGPDLRVDV